MRLLLLGLLATAACTSCMGKPSESSEASAAVTQSECRYEAPHAKPVARINELIWSEAISDQRFMVLDTILVDVDGKYQQCLWHYRKWTAPPDERNGALPAALFVRLKDSASTSDRFTMVNGVLTCEVGVDRGMASPPTPPVVDSVIEYVSAAQDLQSLMTVVRDHQAPDDAAFRGILDIVKSGRRGYCTSLWTDVANDDSYSAARRRWTAKQTLRLMPPETSLAYVSGQLNGATWLKRENMGYVTQLLGRIPVQMVPGDEVFWISFDAYDGNKWGIYFRITGKPPLDDLFAALRGNRSSADDVVIHEIGFSQVEAENVLVRPVQSPQSVPSTSSE
jgi:hypothetical protein